MNIIKGNRKNENSGDLKSKWLIIITVMTFVLSVFFSFISAKLLEFVDIFPSMIILLCIIFVGISFDIIGIAVTSASEAPFHAMAADKVRGSKEAVWLIRNADKVSSVCNDVVGDISGIISGAAGTTIVLKGFIYNDTKDMMARIIMAGLISTITISGKAIGKRIAIDNAKLVVYQVGQILFFLKEHVENLLFRQKSSRG